MQGIELSGEDGGAVPVRLEPDAEALAKVTEILARARVIGRSPAPG